MYDVVTFGEAMIRLSPPHFQRLDQTQSLDVNPGGAELNVAVGVTRFGMKSAWVSKLPKNGLGYLIRENRGLSGFASTLSRFPRSGSFHPCPGAIYFWAITS